MEISFLGNWNHLFCCTVLCLTGVQFADIGQDMMLDKIKNGNGCMCIGLVSNTQ